MRCWKLITFKVLKYYLIACLDRLRKNHESLARADNLKPKNLSGDLPSMKNECLRQLLTLAVVCAGESLQSLNSGQQTTTQNVYASCILLSKGQQILNRGIQCTHYLSLYKARIFFFFSCTSQSLKICLLSSRTSSEVDISEYLGFHTDVAEVFNLLVYDFTSLRNWCPTFRENLVVSFSRVEMPKKNWALRTLNLSSLFVSQLQAPILRGTETSRSYLPSFRGTYCLHLQYWKVLKMGDIR